MTLRAPFPTGDPNGSPLLDSRQALAGLVVADQTGNPRPGVLSPIGPALVTGTATMAYQVIGFRAAGTRQAGGVELIPNDGSYTTDAVAAPTANSRIEIIYARARFSSLGDGTNTAEIGVARGGAALTPAPPAIPVGAFEIARAVVPSGVTGTNSAGVAITQTTQYTAAVGGAVPARTLDQLKAWTTAPLGQAGMVFADSATTNNGTWISDGAGGWNASTGVIVSYTPSWETSVAGSQPAIGNGTLVGRLQYIAPKLVHVYIQLKPGSTTNGGRGDFLFRLPPGVSAANIGEQELLVKLFASNGQNFVGNAYISGTATSINPQVPVSSTASNLATVRNGDASGAAGTGIPAAGTYPLNSPAVLVIEGVIVIA
ncbi:hypothetical protein [Leifsonia aquatica]|uniref:hypothetical protein n=1 Tax=Leifsonia aquatica TaxID=144185 RepID=UPI000468D105|nr:hypothetical protein [Leifsonia aquatica]